MKREDGKIENKKEKKTWMTENKVDDEIKNFQRRT